MKSMLIALGLAAASITAAHSATLAPSASPSATSQGTAIHAKAGHKATKTKGSKSKRSQAAKKA
ncbi:hypothetical protein [Comamonas sp. GB3 AK4-5]|uniref:hypothetical protein n=1 Tax=Comamonas sp. GB3 AK4-5 TaxID=3231487 RepID=UPI00351ECBE7